MYIPMPSPRGTNRAGLFIPASRFGAAKAAYDAKRGLRYGRDQNDDPRDDDTNGEHPAHEVLRRARKSLTTAECEPLRALLGRLLMAEKEDAEDDDDDEDEADGRTGTPDAGRTARDEPPPFPGRPRPGGENEPVLSRAQDAARQHFQLAYGASKRSTQMAVDSRTAADFAARHPEVARIKVI
jgi:hypothetical protein